MKNEQNRFGFFDHIFAYIANADVEVLKKHPYLKKDIINLALLMIGMIAIIFSLQFMSLSSFTGNEKIGFIAATLSAGILFMLDRIVVGGDYETEGEILHLKEANGDKTVIQKLRLKRMFSLSLRVGLGVAIAYAAIFLAIPKILSFEVDGYFNKKALDLNSKANQQLQTVYDSHYQQLRDKQSLLDDLESERSTTINQQRVKQQSLGEDLRNLQAMHENMALQRGLSISCANVEKDGVINVNYDQQCNSSGKPGEGKNYRYWLAQAAEYDSQVNRYSQLINEKRQEINELPDHFSQEVNQQTQYIEKIRKDIQDLENDFNTKLEDAKQQQFLVGSREAVVRTGVIAMSDSAGIVIGEANEYSQQALFLLKVWVMLLELSVFVARFSGAGRDYALALHRERIIRNRIATSA
ncbi:hypothetical protein [Nitrosomonas ureae]|uniref:Uncharacterized protein n=1 Tax=Nitrosomonas ureae TaxID=44577 RepID=A0A1H9E3S6_9PROT|nr:hypothetical protein [Nitrosomonas ureae]SEQ20380.1 hypothetical protein SAMN05421510_102718 [Nitrosomonas ureae]